MFLVALAFLAISAVSLGASHQGAGVPAWLGLAAGVVGLAAGAATLVVLSNHPRASRSWIGGTFFELEDRPPLLAWHDWSALGSRRVSIDDRHVRIVRRALFDLLPVSVVDRPVGDFYRVELSVRDSNGYDPYERYENASDATDFIFTLAGAALAGSSSGPGDHRLRTTYRLSLVDRHANEVPLLTATDVWGNAGEQLVGLIRSRLMERFAVDRTMLGSPLKHAVVNDSPSGPGTAAPAKPHVPQMACTNCHRRFALYVKACPGCKVALFQD